MPKETMSPRERWLAVLTRQTPDRLPMDYWATKEATEKLLKHLDCSHEEMLRRLHIDTPIWATPEYVGPHLDDDEDVWGMKYRLVDDGTGTYREVVTAPIRQLYVRRGNRSQLSMAGRRLLGLFEHSCADQER